MSSVEELQAGAGERPEQKQRKKNRRSSSSASSSERKLKRRLAKRQARIEASPALAQATELVFRRYDADENKHLDLDELAQMILDLQRTVADHVRITEASAHDCASLLAKALDRDSNGEIEMPELQDWVIRKSEKLTLDVRARIMAMHDGGDNSDSVERQVVLVRVLEAVEEIADHVGLGGVVAVFGHGKLGLGITAHGTVMQCMPADEAARNPDVATRTETGEILAGMEIIKIGHVDCTAVEGNMAEFIRAHLANAPRPVQIVFFMPSGERAAERNKAALTLQRSRSRQLAKRDAAAVADRRRVDKVSDEYFARYDVDNNGSLDAEELTQMLLDIIVGWR